MSGAQFIRRVRTPADKKSFFAKRKKSSAGKGVSLSRLDIR
jgi:hypothetical protein